MKPAYIAIIAVAVIAIAGVGIYFAISNGSSDDKLDIDKLKDDIVVGDNIALEMSVSVNNEREIEMSAYDMLTNSIYYALDGGEKVGTETLTFKGKAVECDIYEFTILGNNKYWVDPTTMIIYKNVSEVGSSISSVLADTNLDTSLTLEEQELVKGSFVSFNFSLDTTVTGVKIDLAGIRSFTVTSIVDEETVNVKSANDLSGKADVKETVVAINGDELTLDASEEKVTKDQFRSFVSFDYFKKYLKTMGTVVEGEKKPMGVMDVATGKRNITEQDLELDNGDSKTTYTFQYGDKGVLYSIKYGENTTGVVIIIKNSSLIVKA
jgi:hypothetical protein